ncbi:secretion activator protein [Salinicola corii]|uniref:Secretion activator protein n=1 Tax=Salinicola corii TaxID=2606937 RepID=A0A640WJI5_9GAMM|nr:glycosyl hydrolase 108 family protein [Salinicola corii]KAA0020737.1 secretion activator protein [Salinicola corii]
MINVTFDVAFDRVIGHEGGYTDVRADRGNWTSGTVGVGELKGTKWGISAMSYPELDIRNLTRDDAKAVYKRDFWDKASDNGQFDGAIAYQMFDAGINHGLKTAIKLLQRAAGVKDDGLYGPVTRSAVNSAWLDDLLKRFLAARLRYMTDIGAFTTFGRGWSRRIADNLLLAADDTPNPK